MKKFAIKYDENAWFLPWDLYEIEGFKSYKLLKSFSTNAKVFNYLSSILGRDVIHQDLDYRVVK